MHSCSGLGVVLYPPLYTQILNYVSIIRLALPWPPWEAVVLLIDMRLMGKTDTPTHQIFVIYYGATRVIAHPYSMGMRELKRASPSPPGRWSFHTTTFVVPLLLIL